MLAVDWTEKCRPSSHHSSISLAYIKSSNSSYNISRHWNLKPQICHRLWLANKWGWWRRCRGRCLPKNVLPPPESSSYDHFQKTHLLGYLADLRFTELWIFEGIYKTSFALTQQNISSLVVSVRLSCLWSQFRFGGSDRLVCDQIICGGRKCGVWF